jgi:peptidoglycan/xylan/chitin deacetylase (PgdA/CDA1 family)
VKPGISLLGLCCIACGGESRPPSALPGDERRGSEARSVEPLSDPPPSSGVAAASPLEGEPAAASPPGGPASAENLGAPPLAEPSASAPPMADAPSEGAPASEPSAEPSGDVDEGAPSVTVSFTFDDTYGPQADAARILEAHGLRGTFYVNSPELHRGSASSSANRPLSVADVLGMQARGHDIGGHTLGHLSLTDVPDAERVRELMGDRAQLMLLGIEARSFAYPYGHVEDDDLTLGRSVLSIARASGYASARDTNGFDLEDCARGPESLPPADPFIVRSIRSVSEPPEGADARIPADTADTLLGWIDQTARCGGGWLPLVFHHLREDCSADSAPADYCFDFGELDRLAAALTSGRRCPEGDEAGCYRVQVLTVSAAMGSGELLPAPEVAGLRNPSLERALDSGQTECIRRDGASSGAVFGRSSQARTGQASERLEIAAPFVAAAEIGVERDFGACAIFARAGGTYDLSLHYRADPGDDVPLLRFVTYRLSSTDDWEQWERGVAVSARTPGEWVRADFRTAAVPSDTIAISFSLRQESAGAIEVDDFDSVPVGFVGF